MVVHKLKYVIVHALVHYRKSPSLYNNVQKTVIIIKDMRMWKMEKVCVKKAAKCIFKFNLENIWLTCKFLSDLDSFQLNEFCNFNHSQINYYV